MGLAASQYARIKQFYHINIPEFLEEVPVVSISVLTIMSKL